MKIQLKLVPSCSYIKYPLGHIDGLSFLFSTDDTLNKFQSYYVASSSFVRQRLQTVNQFQLIWKCSTPPGVEITKF